MAGRKEESFLGVLHVGFDYLLKDISLDMEIVLLQEIWLRFLFDSLECSLFGICFFLGNEYISKLLS